MRPVIIVIALVVFLLTYCKSSKTCSTASDERWYSMVDSLELASEVDQVDYLLERLERKLQTPTLAYAYAQYRRGVLEHKGERPAEAVYWYERALDSYCSCEDAPAIRIAMLYKNISAKYARELRQYQIGQEYALRGISFLMEKTGADPVLNDLYFELHVIAGEAEQRLGDGRAALRYYQLAKSFALDQSISAYLQAQMAKSAAVAHKDLQELDLAVEQINEAEKIILGQGALIRADSMDLADVYNDAVLIHLDRRENRMATRRIRQSIALNKALGEQGKYILNLINYARILMESDQLANAKRQLDEALELCQRYDYVEGEAACFKYLGEYYQHRQEFGTALEAFDRSLDLYLGDTDDIRESQYRHYMFFPLKAKALLVHHRATGTVAADDEVWQVYSQLEILLQSLRQGFIDEDSKIFTQANMRPLYEGIIKRCYQGYAQTGDERWIRRALPYFEHSKSLVLQEGIQEGQMLRQILSTEDYQEYRNLQRLQVEALRAMQKHKKDPESYREYQRREAEVSVQLDQFRATLAENYPQF